MLKRLLPAIAWAPFLLSTAMDKGEEGMCSSPFHIMHVDVRHTESKGVGYKNGYTTLEGFGIYDWSPYFMPFIDLRGHVFNNGKVAGNAGIGERSVIPSIDHVFGLYVYYDTRQSEHGLKVNQIGPGIELLGKRMEYRINGYIPVGRHSGNRYDYKFNSFSGNQILLKRKRKYAMTGGDAEVGAHLTQSTKNDFYAGIGPYYFHSKHQADWGGKGRIYWRYKEYVSLEGSYSYDHIFRSIVQGTVTLSYPFGPKLKREGKGCPNPDDLGLSRAAFAPYRFEIPVTHSKKQKEAAINPATGLPWHVVFVNNISSSDGTFESPFPTLVAAQISSRANDMIYIFPGDGTSNGMNQGIVLKNGQKLFGAGIDQTIATTGGTIVIPAQASSFPVLTNTGGTGTVVQVANGNELAGLNIQLGLAGVNLIAGTEVVDGSIHDNIIFGAPIHTAISITGGGTFVVQNNNIQNVHSTFLSAGIFLQPDHANFMTASIINNTIVGYGLSVNMNINDTATTTFDIANNNLTGGTVGVLISGSTTNSYTGTIDNNQMINCPGLGIGVANGSGSNACIAITNNLVNSPGVQGLQLTTAAGASATFNLINNLIENVGGGGPGIVVSTAAASSNICIELIGNTAPNGFVFDNSAAGTLNVGPNVDNVGPILQVGTFNEVGTCLPCGQ